MHTLLSQTLVRGSWVMGNNRSTTSVDALRKAARLLNSSGVNVKSGGPACAMNNIMLPAVLTCRSEGLAGLVCKRYIGQVVRLGSDVDV